MDISLWGLSDDLGRPRRWQFPQGTILNANEHRVIFCDGTGATASSTNHTNFKITRAGGEIICLSDPEGAILDKLNLPLVPTDISYGRTAGTSGFFYYDAPTPGAQNTIGFLGYADAPSFSVSPGLYTETVRTRIIVPPDTTVYYTLDGSVPTQTGGTVYRGEELVFNYTATVLRARAFSDTGLRASDVVTGTYFINAYHALPIVSLVCEPDLLWNSSSGLLTTI